MIVIKSIEDYKKYIDIFRERKIIKILDEDFFIEQLEVVDNNLHIKLQQLLPKYIHIECSLD